MQDNNFTLQFFVINDDDSQEQVLEGSFPTIDAAEDRAANIGSRWYFYPHFRIIDESTGEVVREYIAIEALP